MKKQITIKLDDFNGNDDACWVYAHNLARSTGELIVVTYVGHLVAEFEGTRARWENIPFEEFSPSPLALSVL